MGGGVYADDLWAVERTLSGLESEMVLTRLETESDGVLSISDV
jgi:hypothetical protein